MHVYCLCNNIYVMLLLNIIHIFKCSHTFTIDIENLLKAKFLNVELLKALI